MLCIMKHIIFILSLTGLVLWSSCSCRPLVDDLEPTLEYVSIEPREVVEFQDSMVITLRFTDGDGDIRSQDSIQDQTTNLEVKDLRPSLVDSVSKIFYKFPDYTTNTCIPSIQGTIRITVVPTIIFPRNLQTQKTAFSIILKDAAGNESNVVQTDSITIIR